MSALELRVAIVGLGRAGSALTRSLVDAGCPPVATFSRRGDAAPVTALLPGPPLTTLDALAATDVDVALLAVPDGALPEVARALALVPGGPRVVAHLSGAFGPSLLDAVGPRAAAFHPLAALDAGAPVPAGALVAVDARRPEDRVTLTTLARALHLEPVVLPEASRAQYHAAAAITANLALALVDASHELTTAAGVPSDVAYRGLVTLLSSSVANLTRSASVADALTGVVARGDVATIARHLEALADRPELRTVYITLSRRLVPHSRASAARPEMLALLDTAREDDAGPAREEE